MVLLMGSHRQGCCIDQTRSQGCCKSVEKIKSILELKHEEAWLFHICNMFGRHYTFHIFNTGKMLFDFFRYVRGHISSAERYSNVL